jgi:hypothetical protein
VGHAPIDRAIAVARLLKGRARLNWPRRAGNASISGRGEPSAPKTLIKSPQKPRFAPRSTAFATRSIAAGSGDGPAETRHGRPNRSWRDGKISFDGEPLSRVAATFARYSDTRIIIADPGLAREPVTGLFDAHDPAGFARAIATVFSARVREDGNAVVLTRGA